MASLPTRLDFLPRPTFLPPPMGAPVLKGNPSGPAPSPIAGLTPPMINLFDEAKKAGDALKIRVIHEINVWVQEFQAAHPDQTLQVAFKINSLFQNTKCSPSLSDVGAPRASSQLTALAFLKQSRAHGGAGAGSSFKSEEERPLSEPCIYKTPVWPERFDITTACPFFGALTERGTLGDFALIKLDATVSSEKEILGSRTWQEVFSLDAHVRGLRGGSF